MVQRHRARRLHYDLRFEIDGVLVSWAVPRGPTLDPTVRRQAVHVDDHPMEYLLFEGVIPAGTYGGGDVIVWDEGTWEPHGTDDPAAAVAGGELHAEVHGHKLRGRLVLVRRDRAAAGTREWLLLHKRDEHAVEGWDPEDHPRSVLTGRTSEEVARDPDRLWRSDLPAARASIALRPEALPDAELQALDGLGGRGTWEVYGRRVRLAGLDDVLLPGRRGAPRVTRRDLVAYAARIAPTVVPYAAGRPLVMVTRRPGRNEVSVRGHLTERGPEWLPRRRDKRGVGGRARDVLVVDEPAALVWAAARGAVEWRPWLSRAGEPDLPTHAVLTVEDGGWEEVVAVAGLCRTALDHLGVRGHPVVTARGLQVWVPLRPGSSAAAVCRWSDELAAAVSAVAADAAVGRRRRRLPVVTQIDPGGALPPAAPYSPFAEPGAPVALPVTWEELHDPAGRPGAATIGDVPARLRERGDAFAPALALDQDLPTLS